VRCFAVESRGVTRDTAIPFRGQPPLKRQLPSSDACHFPRATTTQHAIESHILRWKTFFGRPLILVRSGKVFFIRSIKKLISSNFVRIHIVCFPIPSFSNPAKAYSKCKGLSIEMMIQKKQETLNKLRTQVTSFQSHLLILRNSFQLGHLVRRRARPHFIC
jgi:hypothetical protein